MLSPQPQVRREIPEREDLHDLGMADPEPPSLGVIEHVRACHRRLAFLFPRGRRAPPPRDLSPPSKAHAAPTVHVTGVAPGATVVTVAPFAPTAMIAGEVA